MKFRKHVQRMAWLALAVAAAFCTAVAGGFVWLDHVEIEQAGYRVTGWEDLGQIWTLSLDEYLERRTGLPQISGGYWRPVYALSMSLDWLLWRNRPWAFHLENLVWHWLVVVGLYVLGQRLFETRDDGERLAFWAAVLFAVHPLGVHSVTWISGRKDAMCAALAIGAILAMDNASHVRARSLRWMALSIASFLAAVGSKELALVTPLAGAILLWRRTVSAEASSSAFAVSMPRLAAWLALCAAAGLTILYRISVLGGPGLGATYPAEGVAINVGTFARLWWHYVACVLWPSEPLISDTWPIARRIGITEVVAVVGVLLACAGLAYATWRSWHVADCLWWYVVWMLPASGIVPLRHLRAERYLYPASWGLISAVVLLILEVSRRIAAVRKPPDPARSPTGGEGFGPAGRAVTQGTAVLLLVVAIALTALTAYWNTWWRDDGTLFGRAIALDPSFVEGQMAVAALAAERGEHAQAVDRYRRAIRQAGDRSAARYWSPLVAHSNLGLSLYYLRRYEPALSEFQTALRYRPASAVAHYHVGLAYFALEQYVEAADSYRRSLAINPEDYLCRSNLAVTLLRLAQVDEALAMLGPLVNERPDDAINLGNLASILLLKRRFAEAEPLFDRLVRLRPAEAVHRAKLAWCQSHTGKAQQAQQNLDLAERLDPNNPIVGTIRELIASGR